MVDILSDPLVHLVRNAIDHGIEPPDVREQAGKPATGTLRLSAQHAGDSIVVKLQDDGRGLDREKIIRHAINRGLIDAARLERPLTDGEAYSLIFTPGFSTADQVSDVSGRGVGLDVVKRNVEALRGRIEMESEFGAGTTFTLRLPLTLAVTDGMVVAVGAERYLLPTASILTSFRPTREALLSVAGTGELVSLRGEVLPLVRLHRLFGIEGAVEDPANGLLLVASDQGLAGSGEGRYALLVDDLIGQQQVVAKPLGAYLHGVEGISGAAILGDGRVGLIVEPLELPTLARKHAHHAQHTQHVSIHATAGAHPSGGAAPPAAVPVLTW
jgi:two-component system chemotaxis sensor kinase CheA